MAEIGDLTPGSVWRTPNGEKVLIREQPFISTRVTPPEWGLRPFDAQLRSDSEVADWVPWVEPIAVGDRVIVDCWADHDVHHKACATFTDDGEDWVTIRLGFSSGPNFKTLRADECRKVNDE